MRQEAASEEDLSLAFWEDLVPQLFAHELLL